MGPREKVARYPLADFLYIKVPPPHHRKENKIASVTSEYFKSGGGDLKINAAEIFSLEPNPNESQKSLALL